MMTMTKHDCLPKTSDPKFSNDATISNIHRPTSQSFTSNPNRLAFSTRRRRPKRGRTDRERRSSSHERPAGRRRGQREAKPVRKAKVYNNQNGRYEESESLVMIDIDKKERKTGTNTNASRLVRGQNILSV